MDIGEAVEIKQRRAAAVFQDLDFALVDLDDPALNGPPPPIVPS